MTDSHYVDIKIDKANLNPMQFGLLVSMREQHLRASLEAQSKQICTSSMHIKQALLQHICILIHSFSHDAHLCKQLKHDNATVMMHEIKTMFAQLPLLNEYA